MSNCGSATAASPAYVTCEAHNLEITGQNVANAALVDGSHGVCATAYRSVHVLVDLAGSI